MEKVLLSISKGDIDTLAAILQCRINKYIKKSKKKNVSMPDTYIKAAADLMVLKSVLLGFSEDVSTTNIPKQTAEEQAIAFLSVTEYFQDLATFLANKLQKEIKTLIAFVDLDLEAAKTIMYNILLDYGKGKQEFTDFTFSEANINSIAKCLIENIDLQQYLQLDTEYTSYNGLTITPSYDKDLYKKDLTDLVRSAILEGYSDIKEAIELNKVQKSVENNEPLKPLLTKRKNTHTWTPAKKQEPNKAQD